MRQNSSLLLTQTAPMEPRAQLPLAVILLMRRITRRSRLRMAKTSLIFSIFFRFRPPKDPLLLVLLLLEAQPLLLTPTKLWIFLETLARRLRNHS